MAIKIIGDIHQKYYEYLNIIQTCSKSIQVGDFGYNARYVARHIHENIIDLDNHVFFSGNHDNHNDIKNGFVVNCIDFRAGNNRFGIIDRDIFFVSGAYSLDKNIRIEKELEWGKTYFEDEELNNEQRKACLEAYTIAKPKVVLSHDCPTFISRRIGNPKILRHFNLDPITFSTKTGDLLEKLWEIHQPDLWIFGHHHKDIETMFDTTKFICLGELSTYEI